MPSPEILAWVDASAGVAGDMLLAALIDAGAEVRAVQAAVDAVVPREATLVLSQVTRAGLRALKVDVLLAEHEPPHRTWDSIREQLEIAPLTPVVRASALQVFERLAEAEAQVHGIAVDDVHFHEVGARDSIADVVGVCAALDNLGISRVVVGTIAVGSGRTQTEHGDLPVPVPAVLDLTRGWTIRSGGAGELATPTGMALLTALALPGELPEMTAIAVGVGAGSRDRANRANVVRVVLGKAVTVAAVETAVVLECNIDDLDPRLWPGVLDELLARGASDAWLAPILMKKGRPAHTLHVLCPPDRAEAMREIVFTHSSTIGLRQYTTDKHVLPRATAEVRVRDVAVRIKVAYQGGRIVNAMPEFEDVAALALASGAEAVIVLAEATDAARRAGLVVGARWEGG